MVVEELEVRRLLAAANLLISEFLASNDQSITDAAGDHEDWIEIHNAGDADANLNDYFLTDSAGNPEKWRFPVQTLAAGGYLTVFASNRDLAVAGQELHTNFQLDAAGEYLALIRAADDQPQFEYSPTYPVQSSDVSYGLTDANNPASALIYFSVPSPGAANAPSVATPTFSVNGKTFNGSMQVSLSTATSGAEIRYTTDRTVPTATSPLYTGPITLTQSTMLRVKSFAPGLVASPVVGQTYTAVDGTVNTFRSNLPIVVLDSYGAGASMNDATYINASAQFINTQTDGYAEMLDPVDFSGRIGLRYRGSTSYFNYPKKQFAVETRDESDNDKSVSLLGMPSESDWVLYDPYTEKSLINNALAMDWARGMGHYASRVQYVEVYFNANADTSINYSSDYMGVYILMEKPKRDDNRINVDKMLPSDTTEPNITGGYIFKKDRKETQEIAINVPGGASVGPQQFVMVEPDETELTGAQQTWLTNYLSDLDTVMNGPNFADPVNGYAKYIDVDSWVDYWISVEFTKNVDGFWLSNFMHKDRGGKIEEGPVWDYNLAFGQADYSDGASASGWSSAFLGVSGSFGEQYGYYKRLMQDPAFVLKITDRWQQLRKTILNTNNMWADIDNYVGLLTDHNGNYPVGSTPTQTSNNPVVRNFKRWTGVLGTWNTTNSFFDAQGRWIEDVNLMKQWLSARAEWMDAQFAPAPILSPAGGTFGSPTTVTMTPKALATFTESSIMGSSFPVQYLVPSSTLSAWQNLGYTATGWTSGTVTTGKGVGYDTTTTPVNYAPLISVNVQTPMLNVRSSIYTRFTINIANPAAINHLILKMKYDDGFVAWVNGVRVIEAGLGNANTNPVFNSTAPADRDETQATQYVEWDISEIKSQLVAGNNILAIQGINRSAGSNDFLIVPELFDRTYSNPTAGSVYYTTDGSDPRLDGGAINPSALLYSGPIKVSSSTRYRARTLNGGVWGGIADEVYNFDANNLRVTELMYNPAAPPAGSPYTAQDFEFIEFKNIGSSPLNLNGFALNNGATFTFPNTTLAAGAYAVVVKNLAAFQSRYDTSGMNILGVYTGNLDNGGETVAFVNGFAQTMQSFKYQDSWFPQTDGPGYSLVVVDPLQPLANWDLAAGWRASYLPNGSPGVEDTDTTPPTLQSASFDPATKNATLVFSEPVTFAASPGVSVSELLSSTPATPGGFTTSSNSITLAFDPSLVDGIYQLTLSAASVTDSASNVMASSAIFTWLTADAGHLLALPATATTYAVDQLALAGTAKLDVANDTLIIRHGDAGSWNGSAYSGITGLVASGSNGGAWDGVSGIVTSQPAATGGNTLTTLAVVGASQLLGLTGSQTALFDGQLLAADSIIIKYTYAGDANLDGVINGDDYFQIDSAFPQALHDYFNGDFNYDGVVNGDDYFLIDSNFPAQDSVL